MRKTIFILASLFGLLGCSNDKQEEIKPEIKDISEYVYASLNVESERSYECKGSTPGTIDKIFVREGQKVKKGQTIFSITPSTSMQSRLANASLDLENSKDQLYGKRNQLQSIALEIEKVKNQNQLDSLNYFRRLRLWEKEIGSKNELERSLLTYQTTQNRLKKLQLDYEQLKTNINLSIQKAQNQVASERGSIGDLRVRSEIDGEVLTILKESGEYISPQEVFAEIGNMDLFKIRMNIDEVDIAKIKLGDTAIISLEAYPEKVYVGILTYISNVKDQRTQTFVVEARFLDQPEKLYIGLTGEANILVARRKNAILIPSDFLMSGTRVLTSEGIRHVQIGIKNLDHVEILEGIDSSTTILKPVVE